MLRAIEEARALLGEADGDRSSPSALVVILLYEMIAARSRADSAAVAERAMQAIDVVDRTPRDRLPAARAFRALALSNLGGARVWTRHSIDAEGTLNDAEGEALELGLVLPQVSATGHLALLDAMRGRCRAAERRARQALELTERHGWGSEPQSLAAVLSAALVELSRFNPDAADGYVRRGMAASGGEADRAIRLVLAITQVQIAVCRGDAAAALRADARVVEGLSRTPAAADLLVRWSDIAGCEALLLAGRPEEAVGRVGTPTAELDFATSWQRVCLARGRLHSDSRRLPGR